MAGVIRSVDKRSSDIAHSAISQQRDLIVNLPPEILIAIAKLVSACHMNEAAMHKVTWCHATECLKVLEYPISPDIHRFRLVCKLFSQVGLTILGNLIHQEHHMRYTRFILNPTMRCLEVLDAIARNESFRHVIEEIELNFSALDRDLSPLFGSVGSNSRRALAAIKRGDLSGPIVEAYKQHLESHRQAQLFATVASSAKGLYELAASLGKFPRLKQLSVSRHSAICPIHITPASGIPDDYKYGEPRWNMSHFLLQAASAAGLQLQNLVIGDVDQYLFEPAPVPAFVGPIFHLFASLTRITISMASDNPVVERQDIQKWAGALSAAHHLEELDIETCYRGRSGESIRWWSGVLQDQHWTKLRSIRLKSLCIRWEELDALFKRHSHSLCIVDLSYVLLCHGGWRYLLFNMRESLSLKSAFLLMREPPDQEDLPDRLALDGCPDFDRYVTKELY